MQNAMCMFMFVLIS